LIYLPERVDERLRSSSLKKRKKPLLTWLGSETKAKAETRVSPWFCGSIREFGTSPQISRLNTERRARCGLDSCTSDTSASDVQPFSKVLVKQFVFETVGLCTVGEGFVLLRLAIPREAKMVP
jgi:hypothetical protein